MADVPIENFPLAETAGADDPIATLQEGFPAAVTPQKIIDISSILLRVLIVPTNNP